MRNPDFLKLALVTALAALPAWGDDGAMPWTPSDQSHGRGIAGTGGIQSQGINNGLNNGLNNGTQQQDPLQQAQAQFQAIQQQGQQLLQSSSKGRGASNNAAAEAGKKAQESIKKGAEEGGEALKKSTDSFLSSISSSQPKDEGVRPEVGKAIKELSTPSQSGSLTELAAGVIQDIQQLNAVQVAQIQKIAEQFTAPPSATQAPKNITPGNQLAAAGITGSASNQSGNVIANGLAQQSAANVPHNNGGTSRLMLSRDANKGVNADTVYNFPQGVKLPQ